VFRCNLYLRRIPSLARTGRCTARHGGAIGAGGQIILASEPFIPADMWPASGLHTDPLSVYCIAKFGWWESGWTREFMSGLFAQFGLVIRSDDHHSDLERYMIGTRA
jgi:hypothetical protein